MRRGSHSVRVVAGMAAAFLIAIAAFGLILTILWLPRVGWLYYALASGLLAYGLSVMVGGLVAGAMIGSHRTAHGALFGLAFGLVSGWYVLGPMLLLLLIVPLCALCGASGGVLCRALVRRGGEVTQTSSTT